MTPTIEGTVAELVVTTSLDWWLEHGPRVVKGVTRVVLTDKRPSFYGHGKTTGMTWFLADDDAGANDLPGAIFDRLVGGTLGLEGTRLDYPTEQAAADALSRALISWAKEAGK